jgi:cell division protein FtsI (penicillin-binding protein 3)
MIKSIQKPTGLVHQQSRWLFLQILGLVGLFLLGLRLIDLHILKQDFLQGEGNSRALRTVGVPSYRGMITDRLGVPLAVSTLVQSLWINPQEFTQIDKLREATKILNLPYDQTVNKLKINSQKEFMYLARHLSPDKTEKIQKMGIPGVHVLNEYRRFYPRSEAIAHVVGYCDIDHHGKEGLELAYDEILKGQVGRDKIIKDRFGRHADDRGSLVTQRGGRDVALSIDHRIQFLAYRELAQAVKTHQAKAGTVVILDAKTNEVMAMANYPSFNPNQRIQHIDDRYRNRALTDQVEPGSIIKAFSVANILASGKYNENSKIDTSPGWMKVGQHVVKDLRNHGEISLKTAFQKSSNIVFSKLTLELPTASLPEMLVKIGFTQSTGSGFPGESVGKISAVSSQNPISLATLAFGYGMTVTPIQLAQGYSVLANLGVKRPITFIKGGNNAVPGEQVLDADVAKTVTSMLGLVTEKGGSGTRARVNGYTVAGKTGTSRKVSAKGGYEKKYLSLFAGFAPVENPKLVMVVMIDDPVKEGYYGGEVAAPVFGKVMSESLRMLNVPVSKQTEKDLPSLMPKPKDFPLEYPRKGLILAKSYVSMGGR